MINFKLALGRRVLLIKLSKKPGRPKKTPVRSVREFLAYLKKIYQDNRFTGNRVSRVLRRVFEIKKIKEAFGVKIMLVAFLTTAISHPISAFSLQAEADTAAYAVNEVKVTTLRSPNRPLNSFQISQGYHFFHRAIDLRETLGAPVYSLQKGIVKNVAYSSLGYGNHLTIQHDNSLESLYAHLGKINVSPGQEVDENTIIGTVGLSGWTTGPHLHLEIHQDGKPINPLTILQ